MSAKKVLIVVGVVAVVGATAYMIYARTKKPSINIGSVDWQNGKAELSVNGNYMSLSRGVAITERKYTIRFEGDKLTLEKDGKTMETIISKPGTL